MFKNSFYIENCLYCVHRYRYMYDVRSPQQKKNFFFSSYSLFFFLYGKEKNENLFSIISSNERKKRTLNYLLSFDNRFTYLLDYNLFAALFRDAHCFFFHYDVVIFFFWLLLLAFDELNVACNTNEHKKKWKNKINFSLHLINMTKWIWIGKIIVRGMQCVHRMPNVVLFIGLCIDE